MSSVSNNDRVNINSQCIEILFLLNAITSSEMESSITPNFPCGAIISTISAR